MISKPNNCLQFSFNFEYNLIYFGRRRQFQIYHIPLTYISTKKMDRPMSKVDFTGLRLKDGDIKSYSFAFGVLF